jgi:hypothetical protein
VRWGVTLTGLRSQDSSVGQGYARRFLEKTVVAPGTITGSIKPLELAANDDLHQKAPTVPSS